MYTSIKLYIMYVIIVCVTSSTMRVRYLFLRVSRLHLGITICVMYYKVM